MSKHIVLKLIVKPSVIVGINLTYLIIQTSFIFLIIFQIKYSTAGNNSYKVRAETTAQTNGYNEIGLSVAEIARLRGFKAKDYYLNTTDGYILNLVQITHPYINNGSGALPGAGILLMVHGVHTNGRFFISNSIGAKPSNYADKNVKEMSIKQVESFLANDPTSNSLCFTMVNFGWEVWILNRRGSTSSRGHVKYKRRSDVAKQDNSSSMSVNSNNNTNNNPYNDLLEMGEAAYNTYENSHYWNYSLDQQCLYDMPQTIYFILEKTNRPSLNIVGHSAGGAITLMALAQHPEIKNKIDKILLWAPALDLGGAEPEDTFIYRLGSFLFTTFHIPMPHPFMLPIMRRIITVSCWTQYAQESICQAGLDNNFGYGGGQQNAKPGILSNMVDVVSCGEYAQLAQSFISGRTHYLDFGNKKQNRIAYGSDTPPVYNISTFDSTGISIWFGATDGLVKPKAIKQILADLRNGDKVETHYIYGKDLYFNHFSFEGHKNVSTLLIIPCLKTLLGRK